MDFNDKYEKANSIQDMFRLVKDFGRRYFGIDQAGLLVGLSDLGSFGSSFLGAYYSLDANTIVINKRPLARISGSDLYKPYLFHVLLHEYFHSLGIVDEAEVRKMVLDATRRFLGEDHLATELARDLQKFLPRLVLEGQVQEPETLDIEYLSGIDRENTGYIM